MLAFYAVASAAIFLILQSACGIFGRPDAWWLVPALYFAFLVGFVLLHFAVVALSIVGVNLNRPAKCGNYYRRLIGATLPMLFRLARVKPHISGMELVPEDSRFLLVCNHLNEVDPAVILMALPQAELAFVAKKEVYTEMKFVAKAMHPLHCIPIDRENNREAVKAILSAVKLLKEDTASVGIFPEGYTSKTGELQPMRNGAFKIAAKAQVPIVICTLSGTYKIEKRIFRKKTDVYFDILKVISAEDAATKHTNDIGDEVYEMMSENIRRRREEKRE